MKTKEQILEWLDEQPWKDEFYRNFFCGEKTKKSYDGNFLRAAFAWNDDVWITRDDEYQEWYNTNIDLPRSWEEYCKQTPKKEGDYYITSWGEVNEINLVECNVNRNPKVDANVMSKEHCEAFLAYMKLIQLRNAWVKNENLEELPTVYKILYQDGEFDIFRGHTSTGLSFVSEEDAKEFAETFRELLNIAKPLL